LHIRDYKLPIATVSARLQQYSFNIDPIEAKCSLSSFKLLKKFKQLNFQLDVSNTTI